MFGSMQFDDVTWTWLIQLKDATWTRSTCSKKDATWVRLMQSNGGENFGLQSNTQ
jgi:hypothetical protein